VCAAGTLPAELHKLWRAGTPGGYHMEYGYSCMGYEIAGGLGVKLARPEAEVIVMVGDGSYLMLNAEIATSVMLGRKLIGRRARQPRLRLHPAAAARLRRPAFQQPAERLRARRRPGREDRLCGHMPAHSARRACHATASRACASALARARSRRARRSSSSTPRTARTTDDGGCWWEVGVPEVSMRCEVDAAPPPAREAKRAQRV
jgi:3D-(3,5/4)-trihydroxycyclohexane-1,2-dione acylhydrolase (decyclizing)